MRTGERLLLLVLACLIFLMCGCSLSRAVGEIRERTAELRAEKGEPQKAGEASEDPEAASSPGTETEAGAETPVPEETLTPAPEAREETPAVSVASEPEAAETLAPVGWEVSAGERGLMSELLRARGETDEGVRAAEEERLEALSETNAPFAAYLREVLDYWSSCDEDLTVTVGEPPREPEGEGTLAICVLGFALNPDGTMQSELVGRLETALACAEAYPGSVLVVTGGGTAYAAPEVTEADSMALWLTEHGVDPSRILVENRSLSTVENAVYSLDLIEKERPDVKRLMIVSSKYHVHDGMLFFETVCLTRASRGEACERHVAGCCAYDLEDPTYVVTPAAEAARMQSLMGYLIPVTAVEGS